MLRSSSHRHASLGLWLALALVLATGMPSIALAQTADNVLVVINRASPDSIKIGEYYASKRGVLGSHIVYVTAPTTDTVSRADYEQTIETPIAAWIGRQSLQDQVLYLVLTKGIPLRVAGTGGRDGTTASVDSELTLLYRKLLGLPTPLAGRIPNPYFLAEQSLAEAKPFTRFVADTYLVTRLDGFTVDDVLKLVDRGMAPVREGRIVLDEKATLIDRGGDQWLEQAAARLGQAGAAARVQLETTPQVAATTDPVIGYFSWGSNDPANRLRRFGLHFVNGAVGGMFVSTDGRTFAEPPATWTPSGPDGGPVFAGSFQSLAGDLIRDGITGVSGHVAEPFLDATIRPQILFPSYLAGSNLAEAFYLAMPFLSWQTVVIGDPLCAPFRQKVLAQDEVAKGVDPETGLPALFAERRLALLSRGGINTEALKLMLKAEVQLGQDNRAEWEKLLVRAVDLEPRLTAGSLTLAAFYEERGEFSKAADLYRQIVLVEPRNWIALNNLAYAMAVHLGAPKDALPLAERAFELSTVPTVADTLGWIHHLLGDDRAAAPLLVRASVEARDNADIQLHTAFVLAAVNDPVRARQALDLAVKLDPGLANRDDVKALRDRIKGDLGGQVSFGTRDKSRPGSSL